MFTGQRSELNLLQNACVLFIVQSSFQAEKIGKYEAHLGVS